MDPLDSGLALANAVLTAGSTACMVLAYLAIRARRTTRHRNLMLAASAQSAAFLVLFVARFVRFGPTSFRGEGVSKAVFLAIYFSHEPLAVVNVFLVAGTLFFAWRKNFANHKEIAQVALPIWLYVSISGLAIYALLYLWPGS